VIIIYSNVKSKKMRNEDLDKVLPEDSQIGELLFDESGRGYKIIDGKNIYQIEERNQEDRDLNLIINRVRASGLSAREYLNRKCGF